MPTLLEELETLFCRDTMLSDRLRARNAIKAYIEANTPWLPPQQEGFGPWIEWKPGDLGPRIGDIVRVLIKSNRETRNWEHQRYEGCADEWSWCHHGVVAYCVKLPDADDKAVGRKYAFENGCGNG